MHTMPRTARWLALIFLSLELPSWAALPYTLTDLGVLPGFRSVDESAASDINALGQVPGMTRGTNVGLFPQHPYLWSPSTPNGTEGNLLDLATGDYASPRQSFATSINDYGQVAGESTFGGGSFLWTPDSPNGQTGTIVDLGDLPGGGHSSTAADINSNGQVVGRGTGPTPAFWRAYLWSPTTPNASTGSMIDLGTLPDYSSYSYASGINSYGQVVGKSASENANRAFLWTPDSPNGQSGSMVNLGELNPQYTGAEAYKINALGQVVGEVFPDSQGPIKAFLWNPTTPNGTSGTMYDLGNLPGSVGPTFAYGVNSLGQVVGKSDVDVEPGLFAQDYHAYLWTPTTPNGTEGAMVDLNSLLTPEDSAVWKIFTATGINDRGQIAAMGYYDPDGPGGTSPVTRGILLTPPIPEPATVLMAIVAMIGGSVVARRR